MKMVGKNAPGFIQFDFWLAGFDAKKTKRDWISGRKVRYLLVFLVEMGWSSNSRDAVTTAGSPLSDWTDSGKGQFDLLRSMLHSHSFVLTKE